MFGTKPWMIAGAAIVLTSQPARADVVQILEIQLNPTESGLELIVVTNGSSPQFKLLSQEPTVEIEIDNAILNLPQGREFRAENPADSVLSVTAIAKENNTVRISITGITETTAAFVQPSPQGLTINTIPVFNTASGEEITITATRAEEEQLKVPRSVTVIEREDIEQQANLTPDLGEILGKQVPGFAPPTQTSSVFGQTLRGRGVSVLIDGVPQSTNRDAQRDLRTIDPSAIERIEIIRGPSAIFGDGATGGIVNIITRSPTDKPISVKTGFGVNGSLTNLNDSIGYSIQPYIAGTVKKFDYVTSGSFIASGGFFDANGDRIPPDPQNQGGLADLETLNLLGKIGYQINEKQKLNLSINYFNDRQDTEFARVIDPTSTRARARSGLQLSEQPQTKNTQVNLSYNNESLLGSTVNAQIYYRDYLTRFSPFDLRNSAAFGNSVLQSRVESERIGVRSTIDTPFDKNKRVRLLWGVDYFREDSAQPADLFDTNIFVQSDGLRFDKIGQGFLSPAIEQNSTGLFAQLTWKPSDRFNISGGIRQEFIGVGVNDFVTIAGNRINGGDLDYDATLFNIGTVYSPIDQLSIFANFAQGFSIADVARALRAAPPGSSVGSLNPEAQKINNYEIGIQGKSQNLAASLAGFYSTSDLGTTFNSDFEILRDPQQIYGVEANVDLKLGQSWRVGSTFTWLEGDRDTNNDGDYDTPLPNTQIPAIKISPYIENQTTKKWRNRFQILYSGVRDPQGQGFGLDRIDDYVTADLISNLDFGSSTLQIGLENIFNELYFPNISQIFGSDSKSAARGTRLSLKYTINW
ncbi:MAG: TonB-dependent receptor [Prochloraceae cyanobacterium]|nr:TonB-dependent receptor [Prochloraceae cyanobacterium]